MIVATLANSGANSLFLSKIFTFKQKLLVKNLGTPTAKYIQDDTVKITCAVATFR